MGLLAKPLNRVLFLACVLVTGALAGAFVWAFFFCMDIGIEFAWHTLPEALGAAVGGNRQAAVPATINDRPLRQRQEASSISWRSSFAMA